MPLQKEPKNGKSNDARYYKEVASVKVHCERCGRLVARGGMTKHQKTEVCMRLAEERQKALIETDTASSTDNCENGYTSPIIASSKTTTQMWAEAKEPDFDFNERFAKWRPDDGRTLCYQTEDDSEFW